MLLIVIGACLGNGQARQTEALYGPRSIALIEAARQSQVKPATCRSARQAVSFYRSATWATQARRFDISRSDRTPIVRGKSCHWARYAAAEWQARARSARTNYAKWVSHHYGWSEWLPSNWRQLGACETGYGQEPGNWSHDSGSFVSAFGIYRAGYANDAARIGNLSWDDTIRVRGEVPTPREQYEAGLSHLREHGDGWGCPGP